MVQSVGSFPEDCLVRFLSSSLGNKARLLRGVRQYVGHIRFGAGLADVYTLIVGREALAGTFK